MPLQLEDALLDAVSDDKFDEVERLLTAGADPNAGVFQNSCALAIAIAHGNEQILECLLRFNPKCCLTENFACEDETEATDPPRPSKWFQLIRGSWRIAYVLAIRAAVAFILFRIASNTSGYVRDSLLFGANYAGYVYHLIASGMTEVSTHEYGGIYLYIIVLLVMTVTHQLDLAIMGPLLAIRIEFNRLPIRQLNYFWDLVLAVPIQFIVGKSYSYSIKLWLRFELRKTARWHGPFPVAQVRLQEAWQSPAELVLNSLLKAETNAESLALSVLEAGLLAQKPYHNSKTALVLCGWAIDHCYKRLTEYLLREGVNVNKLERHPLSEPSWPSIYEAVLYICPTIGNQLLQRQDRKKCPPRYYQGQRTNALISLMCSERFIEMLRDVDSAQGGSTCLELMDCLVLAGVDPNYVDGAGRTALSYLAAKQPPTRILEHLIDLQELTVQSSEVRENDDTGTSPHTTALHCAVNAIHPSIPNLIRLLESGIPVDAEGQSGETALYTAAYMNQSTEGLEVLLNHGANPDYGGNGKAPPLFRAIHDASEKKFALLLDYGADPNICDKGKSILMFVMEMSFDLGPLQARCIDLLLERGAHAYVPDRGSRQPLIAAADQINGSGWRQICIDKIIDALPEKQLQQQLDSALQTAVRRKDWISRDLPTIFHLITRGANPNSDSYAATLLHHICGGRAYHHHHREDLAKLLKREVVDINAVDYEGKTALHHAVDRRNRDFVLLLLEGGAIVNVKDFKKNTPLGILCSYIPYGGQNYDLCRTFEEVFDEENNPQYQGARGTTALGWEYRARQINIEQSLRREEILQALMDRGADPCTTDSRNRNALMAACETGNAALAANIVHTSGFPHTFLMLMQKDSRGCSAFHLAAKEGHIDALKLLLEPMQVFRPEINVWRQMAIEKAENYEGDSYSSVEYETQKYEQNKALPSFVRTHGVMNFEPPEAVEWSIGSLRRRERDRIELPNVSFSTWELEKDMRLSAWFQQRDHEGWTALHHAAANGHLEVVELLLKHKVVGIGIQDLKGRTAEDVAIENNQFDILGVLEDARVIGK